jgi:dienelactone hydrolase
MGYISQRLFQVFMVIAIGASFWAGMTGIGSAAIKSLLLIPEVVPSIHIHPQRWFMEEPTYEQVNFPVGDLETSADLYTPKSSGKHPAMVLFLGVIPAGRDDPRVVNLARGLARSNIVVLIPWSDVMTSSYRLDPKAVDQLVHAFDYLDAHPAVNSEKIGIGGFCVGASFAALAAEDERIQNRVAYVNLFGGYYDAKRLFVDVASNTQSHNDVVKQWVPRNDARMVFAVHLIEGLAVANDREQLAWAFLEGGSTESIDLTSLSDNGRLAYKLLTDVTREEAETLLHALPRGFLDALTAISPSTRIGNLEAPVLIMHDREDNVIPVTESRAMVEALKGTNRVYYTEFSMFEHMDPTRHVSLPTMAKEMFKLFRHTFNLLRLSS